jgi:hypothetical protein
MGSFTLTGMQTQKIDANESHVYLTSQDDGRVLRQAHAVDMQPEELATAQALPFAVTVDEGGAYWTNMGGGCDVEDLAGSVMGIPLAGGTPVPVATGERCPETIASDVEYVYWARNAVIEGIADDSIVRARKIPR